MYLCPVSGVISIVVEGLPAFASRPAILALAVASSGRSQVSVWVGIGLSSGVLSSGLMKLSAQAGKVACATAVIKLPLISWAFLPRVGITPSGIFFCALRASWSIDEVVPEAATMVVN